MVNVGSGLMKDKAPQPSSVREKSHLNGEVTYHRHHYDQVTGDRRKPWNRKWNPARRHKGQRV